MDSDFSMPFYLRTAQNSVFKLQNSTLTHQYPHLLKNWIYNSSMEIIFYIACLNV